jgi:hypothetical protein
MVMDIREEMKRWMMVLIQSANDADSRDIQKDVKLFLDGVGQLSDILAKRNESLGRQCRPRKASIPRPAPTKHQKQPSKTQSTDDTDGTESGAKGQAEELSHIQQGIQQALAKGAEQQVDQPSSEKLLRQQTYGTMDDDKRLRVAAKALSR